MDVSPEGVTGHTRYEHESSTLCLATVCIGIGLCVVYTVTPPSWVVFRELFIYLVTDAIAVASVVVGLRRYRPTAPAGGCSSAPAC